MIGKKLADRYEIIDELGRGGMGVVYRARDPQLNRDVAIKLVAPSLLTPDTEQRFKTEAQIVARLDHPAIVAIHDFGQHEGSLFFVMPVVEGTSLRPLLNSGVLRLGEMLEIGLTVGEVLEYSQARGVIHRDIKPENIMVLREEGGGLRVRVMDFGLARGTEATGVTKTGMVIGTMSYLSPEQASGRQVDTRSDIYSLGTVLYECVTGSVPFTGDVQSMLYRIVHEIPQSARERGAQIDEALDRIIDWCLAKDPAERPAKPGDLVAALRRYRADLHESEQNKSLLMTRAVQAPRLALAPFVGRKDESRELQQRLNAAVAGECQFAVVSGEAGVGKTRLLDDLEKLAHARQIRTLHGRCVEQDGSFPYYGFCEAIQEYFRQREPGSSGGGQADVSDLGAELVALFPTLGEIDAFRSGSGGDHPPAAGGETRQAENRAQVFELLARTLIRLAAGKPLVLLLEDLHGADVSIEALRYIVRRLGPTPTLIIGTYRSQEVDRRHPLSAMLEGFQGDRHFVHLNLRPLSPAEHRELLSTLTGGTQISPAIADKLFESTEGNPYFTKELVRSLMDSGNLVRDNTGAWFLSGGAEISSNTLPATIQQAVEKRIARLPETLRDVLATAAVMGKSFDFKDLESLVEGDTDVEAAVERLIQEGLVEEERQSRGDTLAFTSGVVREVLYADLSRRKRRSLHRKYAEQLEKRHAGKLDRVYPQLVYHCSEGDVPEKSVEYGLKHARRSIEAFSPEEAIRSVKTALEFLDEEWAGDATVEGDARMLLASALQMGGDVDGALRETGAALRVFEREEKTDRVLEVLLAAARTSWQSRRAEEARSWVERGLNASKTAGDRDKLGQFLALAGTLANLRGEYAKAGELLREAESLGHTTREATADDATPEGGTLIVAVGNTLLAAEPTSMETVEEWEVFTNVFEPLITSGNLGDLVPTLCERWEAQEQGRSFVFPIRPGVRFQDGVLLTAAVVKSAFERSIRMSARNLPPAFVPIRGVQEFVAGQAEEVSGIVAQGEGRLEIRLEAPLPIYPALLADARTAVYRLNDADQEGALIGTGPFRLAARDKGRIRLERHDGYWSGAAPHLDAVEFRHGLSPAAIAAGLETGEFDVSGDLLPNDLERLIGSPRFRRGLVETPKMTTYFLIFPTHAGAAGRSEAVRHALAGLVRTHDLVWQTLGRFAQPAVGLIPPGMLGHDPGRRRHLISLQEARSRLRAAGAPESFTLKAAVHPVVRDRYGSLLDALFSEWKELGVTVDVASTDMASFIQAMGRGDDYDLGVMRWTADYNDPDNFTHNLFHSGTGQFRTYYSSEEGDEILEAARRETTAAAREALYRKFENLILLSESIVPLFHDVGFRLSNPRVRGLRLSNTYPAVNYARLGKAAAAAPAPRAASEEGGSLQIPMRASIHMLDPALCQVLEEGEVLSSIYEPLTQVFEGRIQPRLAQEFRVEEGGRKYRFRLREEMRFHDGRRLTARDVRYSFERLLAEEGQSRREQLSAIRGAQAILEKTAAELAGFQIHSAREFTIELTSPVSFFPVLLSDMCTCIVPEGTRRPIGGSYKEGAVGTGPFRVVRFEPGRRLELERNPFYWRDGYPRSQGLTFEFGKSAAEILSGFRAGRFAMASDLDPADVEVLRRDPAFAAAYREAPSLSTYFILFNRHRGPMADPARRRRVAAAVDAALLVKQTLGRRAIPAHGLIPPGLLGYESTSPGAPNSKTLAGVDRGVAAEFTASVHPTFAGEHAAFYGGLDAAFRAAGISIRSATGPVSEYLESWVRGSTDMIIGRWLADYPDTDTFFSGFRYAWAYVGSPELDDLINRGRTQTEPTVRHAIYREIEDILRRDTLLVPLFHEQVYRFARPELEGMSVSFTYPTVAYETLHLRRT
ncbi:MAG TPA: ABC transporter substrate-binding protein [Candidatus Polarisedimenticolia bacterium]